MSEIVSKITQIDGLYHTKGCAVDELKKAQEALGLKFSKEFSDYVMEFGCISFYGTEWTGLNVTGYLNVVEATLQERSFRPDFPSDCFVIEDQHIDGIVTAVDESGHVFTVQYGKKALLCNSLSEYLDLCIARKESIE